MLCTCPKDLLGEIWEGAATDRASRGAKLAWLRTSLMAAVPRGGEGATIKALLLRSYEDMAQFLKGYASWAGAPNPGPYPEHDCSVAQEALAILRAREGPPVERALSPALLESPEPPMAQEEDPVSPGRGPSPPSTPNPPPQPEAEAAVENPRRPRYRISRVRGTKLGLAPPCGRVKRITGHHYRPLRPGQEGVNLTFDVK